MKFNITIRVNINAQDKFYLFLVYPQENKERKNLIYLFC